MTYSLPVLPPPDAMARELRQLLPQFRRVDWLEKTASTNADLMDNARTGSPGLARPWLLGVHLQERGRGRAGRTWQNRPGANLMFSCAFDVFLPARRLPALSPLAGIAACEALRGFLSPEHRHRLTMKWPNDLQWDFAKLAGILVEATRSGTATLAPDHHVVIIGIGLNLDDARALSQALDRKVADWSEITAEDPAASTASMAQLVAAMVGNLERSLNHVTAHGFDGLPARHALVDALSGKGVDIIDNGKIIRSGIAAGIDGDGQLLVRTGMQEAPVSVGEISVRAQ